MRYIIIFSLCYVNLFGQGSSIFNTTKVHEVKISIEGDDFWQRLTDNYDSGQTVMPPDVPYLMGNVEIDGEVVDSIGIRLKGFSSYWGATQKKSIKLDFNEYVKGRKFNGLKKLNLHNGEGDPAIQRDIICYELFRNAGISAPRTSYTKVYFNDTYWGLYLVVEQVDKTFLKQHLSTNKGNLFKNMGNSDLSWLGQDTSLYQETFELKTDDNAEAWKDFVHFVEIINQTSDEEFEQKIDSIFDVDRYLKVLAIDVATNNWDSYIEHGRNFYIYQHPDTKKFMWIPWDYNLALGGNFSGIGGPGVRKARRKLMSLNINSSRNDTCATVLNGSCPYPQGDSIFQLVIAQDEFCCNNEWDDVCQNLYDQIYSGGSNPPPSGQIHFPVDMSVSPKVLIKRLMDVPSFKDKYLDHWCDLIDGNFSSERIFPDIDKRGEAIGEFVKTDPNYLFKYENFEEDLDQGNNYIPGLKKIIQLRIDTTRTQLEELYSCNGSNDIEKGDLVINEIVASNDSLSQIFDSNGEYEDWIELFNNTDEEIDLSECFLSDDYSLPKKWEFPDESKISPGGYLIVWADKDEDQDGLHSNFKLKKSGEQLVLSYWNNLLDSISFGEQSTNVSLARRPNGTGDFVKQASTFNQNNDIVSSTDDIISGSGALNVYPNPTSGIIQIEFKSRKDVELKFDLLDSYGRLNSELSLSNNRFSSGYHSLTFDLKRYNIPSGVYFLRVRSADTQWIEKFIVTE